MGAVAATYLLARAMFSSAAAVAAALMLVASVTFWAYGGVALAYPALATFTALTALFAYQAMQARRGPVVASTPLPVIAPHPSLLCALSYAIGAGFRPDLALFLFPLLLLAIYRQPPKQAILALIVAASGILFWLIPTALLSGGFGQYLAAFAAYGQTDVLERYAPTERGLEALAVNLRDTTQYLFFALYFEAAAALAGLLLLIWRREYPRLLFLAACVLPPLLFYLFLHVGDPGYLFGVLPLLLVAASGGVSLWLRDRGPSFVPLGPALLTLLLTGNTIVFIFHERPLTLPGLRSREVGNGARLAYVGGYRREEVLIISYDSFRHFRYYLPGHVHNVWLDTATPATQVFPVPPGVRWALLTDPSVFALARPLPAEAEYLPGDTWVAKLAVQPGQTLIYEAGRLRLSTLP